MIPCEYVPSDIDRLRNYYNVYKNDSGNLLSIVVAWLETRPAMCSPHEPYFYVLDGIYDCIAAELTSKRLKALEIENNQDHKKILEIKKLGIYFPEYDLNIPISRLRTNLILNKKSISSVDKRVEDLVSMNLLPQDMTIVYKKSLDQKRYERHAI